jgi:hypothetical protein
MINIDKQFDLKRQTQNMAASVTRTVTLWCGFVAIFDEEVQYIVHTLSVDSILSHQRGKRLLSNMLSCVQYLALLHFITLSHKRHDF